MILAGNIWQSSATSPTATVTLADSYELIKLQKKDHDFFPYELIRENMGLYLNLITKMWSPLSSYEIYEMGGRLGEEHVYGYLAIKKSHPDKIYLVIGRPKNFGTQLFDLFCNAIKRMRYFDLVVFQ